MVFIFDILEKNTAGNGKKCLLPAYSPFPQALPGWLSGERVGLMTWWL